MSVCKSYLGVFLHGIHCVLVTDQICPEHLLSPHVGSYSSGSVYVIYESNNTHLLRWTSKRPYGRANHCNLNCVGEVGARNEMPNPSDNSYVRNRELYQSVLNDAHKSI
jgi:hypothetical protein